MDVVSRVQSDEGCSRQVPSSGAIRLASALGDVVLLLDADGRVESASAAASEALAASTGAWLGREWSDTVTRETRGAVRELLDEAARLGVARTRQVDHVAASGRPVPVAYTVVELAPGGTRLAVGRDLAVLAAMQQRLVETEQTMERDYWKMRQAEGLYRLLFETATDAFFLVDPETLRILDANPAAGRLLEVPPGKLIGKPLTACVEREGQPAVEAALATAGATGRASEASSRLAGDGPALLLSATPLRSARRTLLLTRAQALGGSEAPTNAAHELAEFVERTPDAVVITDADGRIVTANPAFAELLQIEGAEPIAGRPLGDWIGSPGSGLSAVFAVVKGHGSVRFLPASARSRAGRRTEVDLSAVLVPGSLGTRIGFILRPAARAAMPDASGLDGLGAAVRRLSERVGRTPLSELVRDATDAVERHCIRTALELTGGNRTTAAEMLGLSRQSLYVKLRRRGVPDPAGGGSPGPD